MKRSRSYLFILPVIFFTAVSCNHSHDHSEDTTDKVQNESKTNQKLVLNNGKKWNANAETTNGILAMQKIVSDYASGNKTPKTKMGTELQKELDGIFQQCTMKGEAHGQLHHYLVPLIEMVDATKDKEISDQQLKNLQAHLNKYNQYFK